MTDIGITQDTHYNDVMVIIGFGRAHLLILATCGLLLMFTVTETMGMAIIAPSSACEFGISEKLKVAIQSAAFVGMMFSSYIWGYFCDKIGRRAVLLRTTAMAIICSSSSMFITNFWVFVSLRFLTGLCVAGPGFASLTYLGEFCTSKNRAIIINYMCMFNGVGMLYCPGLAQGMVHWRIHLPVIGNLVIQTWRILGLLYAVPGWISFLALLKLPESPKFLLLIQRNEECWDVLNWLCRLNNGKDLEAFGVTSLRQLSKSDTARHSNIIRAMAQEVLPLFNNPYWKRFLISCLVMFGLLLVANGLAIWFTDLRNLSLIGEQDIKHGNDTVPVTVCVTITHSLKEAKEKKECIDRILAFWDSIILAFSFIIEYIVFGIILIYLPRKPLFCVALIISGINGITLPFIENKHWTAFTFIIFLSIPAVMINLMSSALLEFIPTYLRGKAISIGWIFGRIGAITGSSIMGLMIEKYCFEAFMFFSIFPFICAFLGYFLPFGIQLY